MASMVPHISRPTITHLRYDCMRQSPEGVAYYYPVNGEFVARTNREALQYHDEIAMGLYALGVRQGDRVAVMANTRHEWELADGGCMALGAIVVSIYPTSTQEYTTHILRNSESKAIILENVLQWNVLHPVLNTLPHLEHIIMIDTDEMPSGEWVSLAEVQANGRAYLNDHPDLPVQTRDAVQPQDIASIMYTSGTTGEPKGVILRHEMLFSIVEIVSTMQLENNVLQEGNTGIIYLPMSHIMQRVSSYIGIHLGAVSYFAESIYHLVPTCQAAHPSSISVVPRLLEKIYGRIMASVEQAPPERKKLMSKAFETAREWAKLNFAGQPIPTSLAERHAQYETHVYQKLRESMFGKNLKVMYSGSAPLNHDLMEFFFGIGLPVFEGYGLTETCSPITLNHFAANRMGSVGPALVGSEIKIAEDGEILLKGPGVFDGYYNNPEATARAFTEDGWFKSGDIGTIDEDGFLTITDRKKNLIITAAGKNIPPAPIEQKLIEHPLIGQVVVHGDRRKYLVALFTPDSEVLQVWAEQHNKAHLSIAELVNDPDVLAELNAHVEAVNATLASFETIKYFTYLPEEFTTENGVLTPSMKIKRRVVGAKYADVLDEMYD